MGEKEIKKINHQWFLANQGSRFRKIRTRLLSKIKEIQLHLCIKNNREETIAVIIDHIAIYQIVKNSGVLKSSQYYTHVWLFWWSHQHLHYFRTRDWGATFKTTQKASINARAKSCRNYEASLSSSQLASFQLHHP